MTVLERPLLGEPDIAESGRRSPARRPLVIAIGVLVFYLLASIFTDPGGYLSTDTGGKVATLDAMAERGDLRPDLGYWAGEWDDDASLYPMFSTKRIGDQWINVTNLPMLYAALPLYRLGGYELALLIPMLGGVATALVGGRLARQLGSPDGAAATWLIGIASPVTMYSLDLWEHSIGLALMGAGVSLVLDAVEDDRWVPAVLAGLAFGAAASMRQEALVYGAVIGLGLTIVAVRRFSWRGLRQVVAMGSGTVIMLIAGIAIERAAMGSSLRAGRSADTAKSATAEWGARLHESIMTFASPVSAPRTSVIAMSLLLIVGLIAVAVGLPGGDASERATTSDVDTPDASSDAAPSHAADTGRRWLIRGGQIVAAVYLLKVLTIVNSGLGFVPGMLATTPIAGIGLGVIFLSERRLFRWRVLLAAAIVPLPLVWNFQYLGGAGPQWGGRYILLSGLLLMVIGVVVLEQRAPSVLRLAGFASLAITLFGLAWFAQRSHGFADASLALADREEPILVFADAHAPRESGPIVLGEQWLAAPTEEDRIEAVQVILASGERSFGYVDYAYDEAPDAPEFPGFHASGESTIGLLPGIERRVTTFVQD